MSFPVSKQTRKFMLYTKFLRSAQYEFLITTNRNSWEKCNNWSTGKNGDGRFTILVVPPYEMKCKVNACNEFCLYLGYPSGACPLFTFKKSMCRNNISNTHLLIANNSTDIISCRPFEVAQFAPDNAQLHIFFIFCNKEFVQRSILHKKKY